MTSGAMTCRQKACGGFSWRHGIQKKPQEMSISLQKNRAFSLDTTALTPNTIEELVCEVEQGRHAYHHHIIIDYQFWPPLWVFTDY